MCMHLKQENNESESCLAVWKTYFMHLEIIPTNRTDELK